MATFIFRYAGNVHFPLSNEKGKCGYMWGYIIYSHNL